MESSSSLLVPEPVTKRGRSASDASTSDRRSIFVTSSDSRSVHSNGSSAPPGEGSLSFDQLAVVERGRTPLVQAPELLVAEPSPELRTHQYEEASLLTGAAGRVGDENRAVRSLDLPTPSTSSNGRPRAATTSEGTSVTFSNLPPTTMSTSSSTITQNSGISASRPSSRSTSVNSQDASSTAYLSAPRPPAQVRSPSSTRSTKKRSTSGGIAGALALSGVALASPSAQLRQPISIASLNRPQLSPPEGRMSLDTESEGGHSLAGTDSGGLMSMDLLGDFDDVVSQLGTGYAVASSKRNADFHTIFKNIPDDDYLIEDYGCALQREILIQGRIYISEHHLSFNANIFGWVTTHTLPFAEIVSIEKRMTAYVIPNAIQITTLHARYTFASFLSRDTTHDLICNIWRMVHPVVPPSASLPDNVADSDDEADIGSIDSHDDAEGGKRANGRRLRGLSTSRRRGESGPLSNGKGPAASPGGDKLARPTPGSPRTSKQDLKVHPQTVDTLPMLKNLKEVCMDQVFPSAPEKIYNLMFTSGFMKDFWTNNQKLLELQISDWAPEKSGSNLLARSMSYIKPLNGSIGPKQTKCLITDESAHVDFEDYVCVVTTTRTPDVPSGSAFAVKTRTSMTWAKNNTCRVVVTTGVEWSKSSFIKGIIERSCIEGQKTYHADLEKSMRAYIHAHRSEFLSEGQEADVASIDDDDNTSLEEQREVDEGRRPSMSAAAAESTQDDSPILRTLRPFLDICSDVGELFGGMSPVSAGLCFVVAVLVLSNLWTLSRRPRDDGGVARMSGGTGSDGLSKPSSRSTGRRNPDEIAHAVRGALHDYFEMHPPPAPTAAPLVDLELEDGLELDPAKEAVAIAAVLQVLEERMKRLRASLHRTLSRTAPSGPAKLMFCYIVLLAARSSAIAAIAISWSHFRKCLPKSEDLIDFTPFRLTASMFATNFAVLDTHLKHLRGRDNLTKFGQDVTITSGNTMTNAFCKTCGSLMYRVSSGFPGMSILRVGSVDDFSLMENQLRPQFEQVVETRVSWLKGADGIPQYEGHHLK
ncbi:hypothetical protein P7C70_g3146, partial [Phenoliferia sp. Uapishka_3]